MNFLPVLALSCCFLTFSWFGNLFTSLERQFAAPVYQVRKMINPQTIKPKDTYTIVLAGDSMTDYLGSGGELKENLKKYYPNKQIEVHNFSVGSTNITTLPQRLQNLTNFNGRISQPIFNTNFDLIIIESFGHNPLSEYSLDDGLKKHNETLDRVRSMIKQRQPWAQVVLMATIAPHHDRYAEGVINMPTEERIKWARERTAYIKNHIEYAQKHKLPLINVYQKSLIDYINTGDFIHPSVTGVEFISREIAEYIFKERLLPL